jgi:hypothetical protein
MCQAVSQPVISTGYHKFSMETEILIIIFEYI